jgi:hypothetical protein
MIRTYTLLLIMTFTSLSSLYSMEDTGAQARSSHPSTTITTSLGSSSLLKRSSNVHRHSSDNSTPRLQNSSSKKPSTSSINASSSKSTRKKIIKPIPSVGSHPPITYEDSTLRNGYNYGEFKYAPNPQTNSSPSSLSSQSSSEGWLAKFSNMVNASTQTQSSYVEGLIKANKFDSTYTWQADKQNAMTSALYNGKERITTQALPYLTRMLTLLNFCNTNQHILLNKTLLDELSRNTTEIDTLVNAIEKAIQLNRLYGAPTTSSNLKEKKLFIGLQEITDISQLQEPEEEEVPEAPSSDENEEYNQRNEETYNPEKIEDEASPSD